MRLTTNPVSQKDELDSLDLPAARENVPHVPLPRNGSYKPRSDINLTLLILALTLALFGVV